jgi:magnesium-transporting ATPase (P-type)
LKVANANFPIESAFGVAWRPPNAGDVFGFSSAVGSSEYFSALRVSQNTVLFCFVVCLIIWSFSFLQNYHTIFQHPRRYVSPHWFALAGLALILQICFLCAMINEDFVLFVEWNLYLIPSVLVAGIIIFTLDVRLKQAYCDWFEKEQQFLRLEFNTKLGMYSPVSPF